MRKNSFGAFYEFFQQYGIARPELDELVERIEAGPACPKSKSTMCVICSERRPALGMKLSRQPLIPCCPCPRELQTAENQPHGQKPVGFSLVADYRKFFDKLWDFA
jgi:hypothetical protein